jgi:predicted secreted protein
MIRSMNPTMNLSLLRFLGAGALFWALAAQAAAEPPVQQKEPEGVVSLNSSATVEVPKDWMSVTFSVTREGADAATVQSALKQALDAALAQARRVQKPGGQVEVQTGAFSLQPRYSPKGVMNGWSGTTELLVEGRDMATIADLAGHVGTMTISHLAYGLSREAREKVEADVAAQAIARFRAKAADYAKAFGYAGFTVREVTVQTDAVQPPVPRMMAMRAPGAADAGEPLPVEAGKGNVTSNVNGTVQLK